MARPSSAGTVPAIYCDIDDRWRAGALCRGEGTCNCTMGVAWTIMPKEVFHIGGSVYRGETLIQLALQVCERCPVQWDCAEFAIRTDQRWGTWAMHPDDFQSLSGTKQGVDLIAMARRRGMTVQAAVQNRHLIASTA